MAFALLFTVTATDQAGLSSSFSLGCLVDKEQLVDGTVTIAVGTGTLNAVFITRCSFTYCLLLHRSVALLHLVPTPA